MFIIKENLRYGEDYLSYTISDNAIECYRQITGKIIKSDIAELNRLLEVNFGIISKPDCVKPIYEIMELNSGSWKCKKCGVLIIQDAKDYSSFTVKNDDQDIIGTLFKQEASDFIRAMDLLKAGECPICEGWNDGLGNICSSSGWGKTENLFQDCVSISKK